jgi:hypothetical protein
VASSPIPTPDTGKNGFGAVPTYQLIPKATACTSAMSGMPTRAHWVRAKRSRKTGAIHAASHSDGTSDVNGSSPTPRTSQSQEWYFVSDSFIIVLFLLLLSQASLSVRDVQPTPIAKGRQRGA